MKRAAILCAAALALSLLSGCMSAVVVTSPKNEAFQKAWDEAMDEVQKDLQEGLEDEEEDPWSAWAKEWEAWSGGAGDRFSDEGKAHRWKILDAEGEELSTVSDKEAVKTLDDLLLSDNDHWGRLKKDPGDPAYTYVYSQEETLKAGQDPDGERAYEDLLTFTISLSEDVVTMQIRGGLEELSLFPGVEMEDVLIFHVSVPAETAEALRNPSQFSE